MIALWVDIIILMEETESQRGYKTCPRSPRWQVKEAASKVRALWFSSLAKHEKMEITRLHLKSPTQDFPESGPGMY